MADNLLAKQSVTTTCCYCGVGCGVVAEIENNRVIAVTGDDQHPANYGRLCIKGSSLHQTQHSPDRLLRPRINGEDAEWDPAIQHVATRFKQIIDEHGPDSVAFYLSGQLLTEDYYIANKIIKGFIGTANVDTNSRLCMASAVVAHKRAFGGDVVPGCYEDLELADVLILVGSNTAYAHPVVYQRIVKAKEQRPNLQVIVLDPRRTATCEIADLHLPLRPGSDAYFFNGLLAYLAANGYINEEFVTAHCEGFEQALAAAEADVGSTAAVAQTCDVSDSLVQAVYQLFAGNSRVVTVFSQGINQSSSGVDKGNAIINCHLATGKIGREGASPFSITGQPNAMGGREVGGLANQLAAHMGFGKQEDIDRVAKFWQAPNMAQNEGLKAVDMFKAIDAGKIKAVWVMATNPVVSMPDADAVREALRKCDLVVVSECVADTDTAKMADVLLPATTWSEKNGTVTNSERCISLQRGFLQPPGKALDDWQIMTRFAHAMGWQDAFPYSHPVDIFREHARLSALDNDQLRGFNIGALQEISVHDYQNLKPIQWPVTAQAPAGTKRLFGDGQFFTPTKKATLVAVRSRLPQLAPRVDQVIMNTGRIRDQWHSMSRTGTSAKLMGHIDEPYIDVHPDDIIQFQLEQGKLAQLKNRGAVFYGRVKANAGQRRGEVFVPMHWNDKYAASSRADALVNDIVDPICGQPEFKHSPVTIWPYRQAWNGFLICISDIAPKTEYWAKITLSSGYKYRVADRQLPVDWRTWLTDQFDHIDEWAELRDSDLQFYRAVGYSQGVAAVMFSAATDHKTAKEVRWLEEQLGRSVDGATRFALLAGSPGAGAEDEGDIVCSCFHVGDKTIAKAIAAGCDSTETLGAKLKCGTNCGSCIPELKAMLREQGGAAMTLEVKAG